MIVLSASSVDWAIVRLGARVLAAFLANADQDAAERPADAAPPLRPPFFAEALLVGLPLDVVRNLLECQLLDVNYIECGRVEDVELRGGIGRLEIIALITGPGAAARRLPALLQPLARTLFGKMVA
jgi:hypothetical protein